MGHLQRMRSRIPCGRCYRGWHQCAERHGDHGENAERFDRRPASLAHGRVGRDISPIVFMSGSKTKETKKRLRFWNKSNDGFYCE